ncbi:MAG: polyphosphate kinase 2 (PPK2 family), partial [Glaciecola sp.]
MFEKKQNYALWKINKSNRKTSARIRALEYILKKIPYAVK